MKSRVCSELMGVKSTDSFILSNGIRIVPFESMRPSWHIEQLKYKYHGPRSFLTEWPGDVCGLYRIAERKFSPDVREYGEDFSAFHDVALA